MGLIGLPTIIVLAEVIFATLFLTQYFKEVGFFNKMPAQIVSYVFAVICFVLVQILTGGITADKFAIYLIDSVFISVCSNGLYTILKDIYSVGDDDFYNF